MKYLKTVSVIFIFISIAFVSFPAFSQEGVHIIVNSANSINTMSQADLTKIFKSSKTTWNDGTKIMLAGQKQEVAAFYGLVDTPKKDFDKHWIKLSLSGKAAPLKNLADDNAVVSFVKLNSGNIGYVTGSANLAGVKTIEITP